MPPCPSPQGIIFDLDGTLLDTLEDLAGSMNTVLERMGWPTHPVDAYRWFVGNGVAILVQRALPEDQRRESIIEKCVQAMRTEYARRWAKQTRLYAGVAELLKKLAAGNMPLNILTNKPDDAAQEMVRHFFPTTPFHIVAGAVADKPRKPDPTVALEMAQQLGIAPEATLFVGDSNTDMQTAKAAKMIALGAAWGFRGREELLASGAHAVLEAPLELLHWLAD